MGVYQCHYIGNTDYPFHAIYETACCIGCTRRNTPCMWGICFGPVYVPIVIGFSDQSLCRETNKKRNKKYGFIGLRENALIRLQEKCHCKILAPRGLYFTVAFCICLLSKIHYTSNETITNLQEKRKKLVLFAFTFQLLFSMMILRSTVPYPGRLLFY